MAIVVGQGKPSKESRLVAMRKALDIERRSRYADFHGRRSTFSQFMRQTNASLARQFPMDSTWVTLRGLFQRYQVADVATRIAIYRRAEELLEPHWNMMVWTHQRDAQQRERELADEREVEDGQGADEVVRSDDETVGADERAMVDVDDSDLEDERERESEGMSFGSSTNEQAEDRELELALEESLKQQAERSTKRLTHDFAPTVDGDVVNQGSTKSAGDKERKYEGPRRTAGGGVAPIKGLGVNITPVVNGTPVGNPADRSSGRATRGVAPTGEGNAVTGRPTQEGVTGRPMQDGVTPQARAQDQGSAKPAGKDSKHSKDPEEVGVQFVKGVGPKMAATLLRMGVNTVSDLLRHYPRRHLDFANRLVIRDLTEGQEVSIFGMIRTVSAFQSKNRNVSILNIIIADGTGAITITKFVGGRSNKYLLDRIKGQYPKGAQVIASGVVERDNYSNKFTLKNAEIEILGLVSDGEEAEHAGSIHAGRLVPVYPLTEGLSLRYLRTIIHNALESYAPHIEDPLPEIVREKLDLPELTEALYAIHFPETVESKDRARRRLVFDELFAIQLQCAHRRYKFEQTNNALALKYSEEGLVRELIKALPFKLTGAQERVFGEIASDLASAKPMHRLVQGDVGSGKTVVALLACLVAIENGYQAAMMAPTEILAEQHFRQFQRLMTALGLRCVLVLGKQGAKERREVRQQILSGQVHIAVGTHALLEDDVEFKKLGLIVIDEQHRFGVKQRARLKAKSEAPELLTMTATPIPRTLAMTMHGDLDVSEIDELPPGRKPVITRSTRPGQKAELWEFIEQEAEKGRQIYVVFPLIDESESLSAKAATVEFDKLQKKYEAKPGQPAKLTFGLMHGKLKPQEKDEVMDRFRKQEFNVLVSTTVIEVGVDVPNASVMVIENADRFGLAQLHQLRGRVGRGADQSYCFLVSDMKSPTVRERVEIMCQTNDGFVIAEKDLEIRGPGEFLGYRQSGLPDLILADLVQDAKILEDARNTAIAIVKEDPELTEAAGLRKLLNRKAGTAEAEIMRSG